MQEGKKNLSNWQQNTFHMKCDASDSSKGVRGATEEDGKDKCCSRGPCKQLGGLGWREGRGCTPPQTLSELAVQLSSAAQDAEAWQVFYKRGTHCHFHY